MTDRNKIPDIRTPIEWVCSAGPLQPHNKWSPNLTTENSKIKSYKTAFEKAEEKRIAEEKRRFQEKKRKAEEKRIAEEKRRFQEEKRKAEEK